jgi:hypothetical protein
MIAHIITTDLELSNDTFTAHNYVLCLYKEKYSAIYRTENWIEDSEYSGKMEISYQEASGKEYSETFAFIHYLSEYCHWSAARKFLPLEKINEYGSPKLKRQKKNGKTGHGQRTCEHNNCSSSGKDIQNPVSSQPESGTADQRTVISQPNTGITTQRTETSHPKRLTQRTLPSDKLHPQLCRCKSDKALLKPCSNVNTHYLLEYRKRQRQMSI